MLEKIKQIAHLPLPDLLQALTLIHEVKATFSSSLSWEDQVITDAIFTQNLPITVFTLDTGRLFPETYSVLQATNERYKKQIQIFFPENLSVEKMVNEKGPISFYESVENRKECCFIRKVEPLNRALEGYNVWITGLRAEHSENRQNLEVVEIDEQRKLIKINPLIHWTLEEVQQVIAQKNIPTNALQNKGFISIGCQPCTRAVKEGESFRSGRWWWEDASKKECGLHS